MPGDHGDGRLQRIDGIKFDAADERGLIGVERRHDEFSKARFARAEYHRQDAAHGAQFAVQCQLAKRDELLQGEAIDLFVDADERQRDGQVECRPGFTYIGRREIDEQLSGGIGEAGVDYRRAHAFARFAQRPVGQSDDRKVRRSGGAVGFDAHDIALDAEHRS